MLNIFSGTCWPSVYFLEKNLCPYPLPVFTDFLRTHFEFLYLFTIFFIVNTAAVEMGADISCHADFFPWEHTLPQAGSWGHR